MSEDRSMKIYSQVSEAEDKFDYFISGLIAALCGYIGQNYVATRIGLNSSTLELVSIIFLIVSFVLSILQILFHRRIKSLNVDLLQLSEGKSRLIIASNKDGGQTILDESTGQIINKAGVPSVVGEFEKAEKEVGKEISKNQGTARKLFLSLIVSLCLGFMLLLASKVVKPYLEKENRPSAIPECKCPVCPHIHEHDYKGHVEGNYYGDRQRISQDAHTWRCRHPDREGHR
jgi:predicted PurR-regulated permease PerM